MVTYSEKTQCSVQFSGDVASGVCSHCLLTINKEMTRDYLGVPVLKERSQAWGRGSQIAVAVAVLQRGQERAKLFQRWWKKHMFSEGSRSKLFYRKNSTQKCSWAPHLLHWVVPASKLPSTHLHRLKGPGDERVSWQQAPQKGGLPLLERQENTGGAVQLLYNAPEARAPRQLIYSSKPTHLLLHKSHWLLWSNPLPSHSTRLNQQIKRQPSGGLAHRDNPTGSDEPRGDAREVALQLPLGLAFATFGTAEYLLLVFLGCPHPMHPNPQFSLSKKAPHMQSNSFQLSREEDMQSPLRYRCHEKDAAQSEATKGASLLVFQEGHWLFRVPQTQTLKFCHKI